MGSSLLDVLEFLICAEHPLFADEPAYDRRLCRFLYKYLVFNFKRTVREQVSSL
jgi:hypothetical protein